MRYSEWLVSETSRLKPLHRKGLRLHYQRIKYYYAELKLKRVIRYLSVMLTDGFVEDSSPIKLLETRIPLIREAKQAIPHLRLPWPLRYMVPSLGLLDYLSKSYTNGRPTV